jgi:tRNA threonylcarbamoyladenosine biosynthesis protein TsaB
MPAMSRPVSIAIETSCRAGGVALGRGDQLVAWHDFDASRRHAVSLLARLDELLGAHELTPSAIDEVYVSVGPGSFTGLRIGVTVARTLGQLQPSVRCVAVPTPWAIARNLATADWKHLAVVLDAKGDRIHVTPFTRRDGQPAPAGDSRVVTEADFLTETPRPIVLLGEGLGYHDLSGDGIEIAPAELALPTAVNVWHVGRQLARDDQFTPFAHLLPTYTRKPEAVRLWEAKHPTR